MKKLIDVIPAALGEKSFSSQYSDPRWKNRAQQFRRSIGSYCQSCRRGDLPIQVHHVNYSPGELIWEADDQNLALLCEPCHKLIHKSIRVFRATVGRANASNSASIAGILYQLVKKHGDQRTAIKLASLL